MFRLRRCKLGVFEGVPFDFTVDATDFGFTAAQRAQADNVGVVRGQDKGLQMSTCPQ
jgi:hypothetical protein